MNSVAPSFIASTAEPDGPVSSHDDDREGGPVLANPFQDINAAQLRHFNVQEDEVRVAPLEDLESGASIRSREDLISFYLETELQNIEN